MVLKFIVDAQLPSQLCDFIKAQGCECVHTSELIHKNRTSDKDIIRIAQEENRIVVSKDSDFFESFIAHHIPPKLLMISTGNIRNKLLMELFEKAFPIIRSSFLSDHSILEIDAENITVHY